ncbi:hypothetical protein BBR47_44620 [Brevibacillus brevis NBRC 100599]|uniref:Uncharacterized protein n=1 Tax=Brevibacillus brevis (strain 47 / JCM 6285 / NBRC 100599) TaxID=358681 RepID=C0ZJ64_BREBN|nr:hypothetical protein [Brevibacillus brevis]BAH45439.1 hypothetical protein BBR47_44620 [Brevibacillus brevis NBRC 100599]
MTKITIILQSESTSNLLMTIKKHTAVSLSEIKNHISNNIPLMEVDYVDNDEMEKMRALVEDLIKNKARFKLYEQDEDYKEELPLDHFMNSFELSRQIAEDRERLDDILVEEDDE